MRKSDIKKHKVQLVNLGSKKNRRYSKGNSYFKNKGFAAVPFLIENSKTETDILTLCRIAMLLGNIGDENGFEALKMLTLHPSEGVRYDAIEALGRMHDDRILDLLTAITKQSSDPPDAISSLACHYLAKQGDRAVNILSRLFHEGSHSMRLCILDAIGKSDNVKFSEYLSSLIDDEGDDIRAAVIEAMGNIPVGNACIYILAGTNDPNETVRDIAAYWLNVLKC